MSISQDWFENKSHDAREGRERAGAERTFSSTASGAGSDMGAGDEVVSFVVAVA